MTDTNHPARVRLFGPAQADGAYNLRDFLQRRAVAFDWIELHSDEDSQRELGIRDLAIARLPVVELPVGWGTQPHLRRYDLSIYGTGPAG